MSHLSDYKGEWIDILVGYEELPDGTFRITSNTMMKPETTIAELMKDKESTGCFKAKTPDGTNVTMCRDSFRYDLEKEKLLSKFPDIMDWIVIDRD